MSRRDAVKHKKPRPEKEDLSVILGVINTEKQNLENIRKQRDDELAQLKRDTEARLLYHNDVLNEKKKSESLQQQNTDTQFQINIARNELLTIERQKKQAEEELFSFRSLLQKEQLKLEQDRKEEKEKIALELNPLLELKERLTKEGAALIEKNKIIVGQIEIKEQELDFLNKTIADQKVAAFLDKIQLEKGDEALTSQIKNLESLTEKVALVQKEFNDVTNAIVESNNLLLQKNKELENLKKQIEEQKILSVRVVKRAEELKKHETYIESLYKKAGVETVDN